MKECIQRILRRVLQPRVSPSVLVVNEGSPRKIQTLICNLLPNNCRIDQLEGRDYLVVPMVILTEGVHVGSQGPLYYPKDELSKTPVVWNHKPIVVYHPTMNGEGISACDPVVLNNRKVGLMMNTRFEGGRLKSEAWIDRSRADAVDDRIMAAIDAKEMMELSTGVFVDTEDTSGKWKSEEYVGIARNYRPDHLALLPDQIGACSIADGAGLLRNANPGQAMMDKAKAAMAAAKESGDEEAMVKAKAMMAKAKAMMVGNAKTQGIMNRLLQRLGLTENEMSFSDLQMELCDELNKKFNPSNLGSYSCYVVDVFSNFVIFSMEGKLLRIGYSASDNGVEISNDPPVEVIRTTVYKEDTVNNSKAKVINNHSPIMHKRKLIDILLANAVTALNGVTLTANMTDDQLKAVNEEQLEAALKDIIKNSKAAAPAPAPEKKDPAAEPAPANNIIRMEDFIKQAPPQIAEVLTNGVAAYAEEKKKLVETIMNSKGNGFAKVDLENKPLGELKLLAQLAAASQPPATRPANFSGLAPTDNTTGEEAPLELPVMNFAKK